MIETLNQYLAGLETGDAIAEVRDALLAVVQAHEKHHPGTGEACWGMRLSALGMLCHSLGVLPASRQEEILLEEIRRYQELCPACPHASLETVWGKIDPPECVEDCISLPAPTPDAKGE